MDEHATPACAEQQNTNGIVIMDAMCTTRASLEHHDATNTLAKHQIADGIVRRNDTSDDTYKNHGRHMPRRQMPKQETTDVIRRLDDSGDAHRSGDMRTEVETEQRVDEMRTEVEMQHSCLPLPNAPRASPDDI